MPSAKESKPKRTGYGVWPYPCTRPFVGLADGICGGELRTRYDKRWEQLEGSPPGTPDPERPYRSYRCVRCHHELRQPRGKGALYDPKPLRPDISEYSQRVSG